MWHVSTSMQGELQPLRIVLWTPEMRAAVRRWTLAMLDGVGDDENLWAEAESGRVLHLRRRLRPDEVALLDAAWCALPAVHDGGLEDRITSDWS